MTKTENVAQVVGMNDEQTECDRCGKLELRGTVIVADESGEIGRYGTTCVGYVLPSAKGITRDRAVTIEAVRRDKVVTTMRSAHAYLAAGDWRMANRTVTLLAQFTTLHRADEVAAVAAVRAKSREIRQANPGLPA